MEGNRGRKDGRGAFHVFKMSDAGFSMEDLLRALSSGAMPDDERAFGFNAAEHDCDNCFESGSCPHEYRVRQIKLRAAGNDAPEIKDAELIFAEAELFGHKAQVSQLKMTVVQFRRLLDKREAEYRAKIEELTSSQQELEEEYENKVRQLREYRKQDRALTEQLNKNLREAASQLEAIRSILSNDHGQEPVSVLADLRSLLDVPDPPEAEPKDAEAELEDIESEPAGTA